MKNVFESIEYITLDEFVDRMSLLDPRKVRSRKNNWLKLIKAGKLTCPATQKRVSLVSLDKHIWNNTFHYNFYSEDLEMFTIDHIIPISKGGKKTSINNIQPMIAEKNWEKGNQTNLGY